MPYPRAKRRRYFGPWGPAVITPAWFNVMEFGAVANGTADDQPGINAAFTAAKTAGGGVVYFPYSATYRMNSGVTATLASGAPISVFADPGTVVSFYGSGDCFRILCPTLFTSPNFLNANTSGGFFTGLTVDGTHHTGTGASGLHLGDVFDWDVQVAVRNFTAASDIGVHFDNTWFWTERLFADVRAYACTTSVMFDQNPAGGSTVCTGSFDGGNLNLYTVTGTGNNFNGPVFNNGTYMDTGQILTTGSYQSSASSTGNNATLSFIGSSPVGSADTGVFSHLNVCLVNFTGECEGSAAHTPYTIYFGTPSSGNFINNCLGVTDFIANSAAFTTTNAANAAVIILGPVAGENYPSQINQFMTMIGGIGTSTTSFMGSIDVDVAGSGLSVKEVGNAKQGTAVLSAGTKVVSNTNVTANSRIFLTSQVDGGSPGFVRVSARSAGTSFTITSSSNTDTSTIAYEIFEPG